MFCLLSVIFPSPALKPYTNTDNPTLTLIPLFAILIVTQTDTCKIDQLGKQGFSITFSSTGVLVLANLNQTMPTQGTDLQRLQTRATRFWSPHREEK